MMIYDISAIIIYTNTIKKLKKTNRGGRQGQKQ